MRILIISTFFPPLNSIASLRPYSWAKYWFLAGHDVTVLTTHKELNTNETLDLPNPGFKVITIDQTEFMKKLRKVYADNKKSSKKNDVSQENRKFTEDILNKVKGSCISIFDWLRYKKGIFNACRMPDVTDLWVNPAIKEAMKEENWDFIISTAGPYSVHLVAHALKKKGKTCKWVADYRDTWSEGLIYPGLFPFNLIEKSLEKKILRDADIISTVSPPFTNIYNQKYPTKKVYTLENGFDPEDLEALNSKMLLPDDGKLRIVHTGSIYEGKRDPKNLFAAIENLSKSDQYRHLLDRLEVIFAGPRQEILEKLIEKYNVEKWVRIYGFVKREDSLKLQREGHWLLFLPWSDSSVDGMLTGKIFEYLYSGTPIMAVGGNGLESSQRLILEAKAGVILESVDAIKQFLLQKLTSSSKERTNIDPSVLGRYDRKVLADRLLKLALEHH